MDKSMDSIGSCSLDVDGVSTDFSDTSSSLNLLTPSSAKDFTREFTSGIHERCRVPITVTNNSKSKVTVKTTTTISQLDPNSGKVSTFVCLPISVEANTVKKPSYINLACCVNGYSNLTTYDSKLRQDINRSREVSPIRPITQYFYNRSGGYSQHLSIPFLRVPTQSKFSQSPDCTMDTQSEVHSFKDNVTNKKTQLTFTNCNGSSDVTCDDGDKRKSFIQQRVERLYGKDSALAQGFLAKRKSTETGFNGFSDGNEKSKLAEEHDSIPYNEEFVKPIHKHLASTKLNHIDNTNQDEVDNVSLPVLRHLKLNSEFRKQLQLISPKKSVAKNSTNGVQIETAIEQPNTNSNAVDRQVKNNVIPCDQDKVITNDASNSISTVKDGHFFLKVMNNEKDRLLGLASKVEMDLEFLLSQDNEEFEEVIGYLRAATGKAKLLCTQKMKQFRGLCENNICRSPNEPFETKPEDLQGFWDMVMIQVDQVDSLFQEIELMKNNDWKKPKPSSPTPPQGAKMTRKPIHSKLTDQSQTGSKKSSTSAILAQKREAQRKHFAELKRKNKLANSNAPDELTGVEFFVSNKS